MNAKTFSQQLKYLLQLHLFIFHVWSWVSITVGAMGVIAFKHYLWYFSLMTLSWGGVNLLVFLCCYWHIRKHQYVNQSLTKQIKVQYHIEKILFLNIGLDIGYIVAGILFFIISEKRWQFIWHEFGYAILLQGVFLLSLDTISSRKHYKNRTKHLLQD